MRPSTYLAILSSFLIFFSYQPAVAPGGGINEAIIETPKKKLFELDRTLKQDPLPADDKPAFSTAETRLITTFFCDGELCPAGDWQRWIIFDPENPWSAKELIQLQKALTQTFIALDEFGIDGPELLAGYRFRRQHGEFLEGRRGFIGVARHRLQEIVLSDSAFVRLNGFYIHHEIAHAVDVRLDRGLSEQFALISDSGLDGEVATGFWMNNHAHSDVQEAVADAYALWIHCRYLGESKPVFPNMPGETDTDIIIAFLEVSLRLAVRENYPRDSS